MTADAYPLHHWTTSRHEIPEPMAAAIAHLVQAEDPTHELPDGVVAFPLAGAGNHSVLGLRFTGRSYCLKRPQRTNRHRGIPEIVVRREVGGMCSLWSRVPDRCPQVLTWSGSPAWLLATLVPGTHLGNVSLTAAQIDELAAACRDVYRITPDTANEPLWPIDWPIEFLVDHLRDSVPQLKARGDEASSEAAALVSEWIASDAPTCFLETSDRLVFARGDQNMANAIWDGRKIRFVDFEYCGWNDMARDLSLVTEHIQSYATPVALWDQFVDHFDLSPPQRRRLQASRRRLALHWLARECLNPGSLHSFPAEDRLEALLSRARDLRP